jgi:hypothetical protein
MNVTSRKKVDPQLGHVGVALGQEVTSDDKGDFDNPRYCYYEHRGCVNESVHEEEERPAQLALVLKVEQCTRPNKDQRE